MNKLARYLTNLFVIIFILNIQTKSFGDENEIYKILQVIQQDLKTLEKAVYSGDSFSITQSTDDSNLSDNTLTRHLLKLSEIEQQFQELTNKFEEINFKIDKLSSRISKSQADNQLRFQDLEEARLSGQLQPTDIISNQSENQLPGSSEAQNLGRISDDDLKNTQQVQTTQSVESSGTVLTEKYISEEKILPEGTPKEQYDFALSFVKVGDYETAEIALREFVIINAKDKLAGSAQYWYAETFRIRQLYQDAAEAYLEGYQKYPKSSKAPVNLLKLGVSLVQIGEKDQGCSMITGVRKQYPQASQSVLQKAKYEEKKFDCPTKKS
jgi:tol-pal system protein YbgF